ncbi:MAG: CBS domain-containing protein [Planctomycetaceae bacterium]|nr:CBS domain-containing protein [Planctomycetaceae bacterium]
MGLQENMRAEQVRTLSLREPVTVSPDEPLNQVVDAMKSHRLGCAIIVDADGKPIGIFTESQLIKLLADESTDFSAPVSSAMESNWPSARDDAPIVEVLNQMTSRNLRFVIVVDAEGNLVGLTGQRGLLEYIADHFPEQVMVQRIGGTPHLNTREGA